MSMPGKRVGRWAAITCSMGTRRPWAPTSRNRGRRGGTLTRAKRLSSAAGSCRVTARFMERLEMKGKGWAGSNAQGGEHRVDVALEHLVGGVALLLVEVLPGGEVDAVLGQAGDDLVGHQALRCGSPRARQRRRMEASSADGAGSPGDLADPGGHLLPQAGHPDLEELVEVRGDDGDELDPLQQGDVGVLGDGEDPLLEVQERQLTVGVAGFHAGWWGHRHGIGRPGACR